MSIPQEQINKVLAEEIKKLQATVKVIEKDFLEARSRFDALKKSAGSAGTADKAAQEAKAALADLNKRVAALEKKAK